MRYFLLSIWFLWCGPVLASDITARASFDALAAAVKANDAAKARAYLTQDSQSLYDRFVSYKLLACVPKDTVFVSEQPQGSYRLLKGSLTDLANKKRTARLLFSKENGEWKLNLPLTLRNGLGKNWQNQVHLSEQLFLIIRKQTGGTFNCNDIRELAQAR